MTLSIALGVWVLWVMRESTQAPEGSALPEQREHSGS
jgi:hypothetical protein